MQPFDTAAPDQGHDEVQVVAAPLGVRAANRDRRTLHGLNDRYARLVGELQVAEERVAKLRSDMQHMEATIRIYRADWTGDGVVPRRPCYPNRYIRHGDGTGTIADILREADRPLSVREVVAEVMVRLNVEKTSGAVKSLGSTVRYYLEKEHACMIERIEGKPRRFKMGRGL